MRNDLSYTEAGFALKLSLGQVRDRAMKGQLEARRDEQGRYRITRESVERYQHERKQTRTLVPSGHA
jgi:hypothetical protein